MSCEHVCVATLQPPPSLFSDTHIVKQFTLSSSCQKTMNEERGGAVALMPYQFSVLYCTGYISMQISTNSSSAQGWTDLSQLCETPDTSGQRMEISTQATPQAYVHNKALDSANFGFPLCYLSSKFLHFVVDTFVVETWMPIKMKWFIYHASSVVHFDTEMNNSTNTKHV